MAEDKGRKKFVRGGLLPRALDLVERWGNSLPHPFSLFVLFSLGVLVLSWIASSLELSAIHPATGKKIAAVNLLDRQGFQNIITKAVSNFTGFAPLGTGLGTLLAMMLPYSIAFAISWIVLLALWLLFGIPLGPGASLTYHPLP